MTTEQELVKKIEEKLRGIDTILTSIYLVLEQLKAIQATQVTKPTKPFDPADYEKLACEPGIDKRYS